MQQKSTVAILRGCVKMKNNEYLTVLARFSMLIKDFDTWGYMKLVLQVV